MNPLARREFILAVAASATGCRTLVRAPERDATPVWADVERLCERFVEERRAPAISLAASRDGDIVFARGFGSSDLERSVAATPGTFFRIASVTKTFVGALLLRLAREGALTLDDPAARWLPEFPRSGEFTLRMMLNHTSGLAEYTQRPFDSLVRDAGREYSNEELVAYMAAMSPVFTSAPGSRWRYSNTGYVLLGVAAERAGGAVLPVLIERHVVGPAGLRETAWDSEPERTPGRATGYGFRRGRWVRAPLVTTSYVGASGGIRSTAPDLCRWFHALFGESILTRGELREMLSPARLTSGRTALTRSGSGYGLGIWVGSSGGRRVAWHAGSTAGFAADARHYPDDGITVAMLGNADAGRMGSEPRRIREAVLGVPGTGWHPARQ